MKTVVGIFNDKDNAEEAINVLKDEGYNPKDISVVMKDKEGGSEMAETGADVAGGALSGATTGAILGGIAGIVSSALIPGLGAFFIGGPIAAALGLTGMAASTVSGAATGALAGGLIGGLTGLGLSDEDAEMYENRVKEGGILIAVPARMDGGAQAQEILNEFGAEDVKIVSNDNKETMTRSSKTPGKISEKGSSRDNFAFAGKGGRSTAKKGNTSKGRGWHGDPKGHSIAGRGEDVPGRGEGK